MGGDVEKEGGDGVRRGRIVGDEMVGEAEVGAAGAYLSRFGGGEEGFVGTYEEEAAIVGGEGQVTVCACEGDEWLVVGILQGDGCRFNLMYIYTFEEWVAYVDEFIIVILPSEDVGFARFETVG